MDGEMRRAMVRRVVESDMTERVALSLGVKRPRRSVWRPQQSTRKERLLALGVRCFRSAPHPSGAREEEGGPLWGGQTHLHPSAGSGMPSAILLRLGRKNASAWFLRAQQRTACVGAPVAGTAVGAPGARPRSCSDLQPSSSARVAQGPAVPSPSAPQPPRQPLCREGPPGLCPQRGCGRL